MKSSIHLNNSKAGPAKHFVNVISMWMKALTAVELLPQDLRHLLHCLELLKVLGCRHDNQHVTFETMTLRTVPEGAVPVKPRMKTNHLVFLAVGDQ